MERNILNASGASLIYRRLVLEPMRKNAGQAEKGLLLKYYAGDITVRYKT
jgi:hypothetical protein